jgi:hypothetical protein
VTPNTNDWTIPLDLAAGGADNAAAGAAAGERVADAGPEVDAGGVATTGALTVGVVIANEGLVVALLGDPPPAGDATDGTAVAVNGAADDVGAACGADRGLVEATTGALDVGAVGVVVPTNDVVAVGASEDPGGVDGCPVAAVACGPAVLGAVAVTGEAETGVGIGVDGTGPEGAFVDGFDVIAGPGAGGLVFACTGADFDGLPDEGVGRELDGLVGTGDELGSYLLPLPLGAGDPLPPFGGGGSGGKVDPFLVPLPLELLA